MNGTRNNTSLSMLGSMEAPRGATAKEGNTLATEDSMTRNHSSSSNLSATHQKSRRGAKKERGLLPDDDNHNSGSMENSLSDMFSVSSGDYLFTDGSNKEGATISTMDSLVRKESSALSSRPSRRGGRKDEKPSKKSDMERSLSELLIDDDADDDDEHGRKSRESLTIVTKDSLQKAKESAAPSKRGGRKVTRSYSKEDLSSSLGLRGGPASASAPPPSLGATLGRLGGLPKDFGRQADDNDTFCGLGTVGEKELSRGGPLSSQVASSPTKTKITMAPTRTKTLGKAMPSPFSRSNDDDSDSEDEDLFRGFSGASNNPFRMPTHL